MPLLSTRGGASTQGFGLLGRTAARDGTVAIFQMGNIAQAPPCRGATRLREKYTYATNTSVTATLATSGTPPCGVSCNGQACLGSGAGNNTRAIFSLGTGRPTLNKYTYANCTSAVSGYLTKRTLGGSAAGNSTRGIFAIGLTYTACGCAAQSNTRNKYTYATCSNTATGVATGSSSAGGQSATGNSTVGIFAIARVSTVCPAARTTTRNKYTYATCSNSAATCFTYTPRCTCNAARPAYGAAAGNATVGIFAIECCFGQPFNKREKYTYSNDVSTTSGVAVGTYGGYGGGAAGNSLFGIFATNYGGGSCYYKTRNKYTYATCTSTACGIGNATVFSTGQSAASWAACVNSF
jgi:hypothetical protein